MIDQGNPYLFHIDPDGDGYFHLPRPNSDLLISINVMSQASPFLAELYSQSPSVFADETDDPSAIKTVVRILHGLGSGVRNDAHTVDSIVAIAALCKKWDCLQSLGDHPRSWVSSLLTQTGGVYEPWLSWLKIGRGFKRSDIVKVIFKKHGSEMWMELGHDSLESLKDFIEPEAIEQIQTKRIDTISYIGQTASYHLDTIYRQKSLCRVDNVNRVCDSLLLGSFIRFLLESVLRTIPKKPYGCVTISSLLSKEGLKNPRIIGIDSMEHEVCRAAAISLQQHLYADVVNFIQQLGDTDQCKKNSAADTKPGNCQAQDHQYIMGRVSHLLQSDSEKAKSADDLFSPPYSMLQDKPVDGDAIKFVSVPEDPFQLKNHNAASTDHNLFIRKPIQKPDHIQDQIEAISVHSISMEKEHKAKTLITGETYFADVPDESKCAAGKDIWNDKSSKKGTIGVTPEANNDTVSVTIDVKPCTTAIETTHAPSPGAVKTNDSAYEIDNKHTALTDDDVVILDSEKPRIDITTVPKDNLAQSSPVRHCDNPAMVSLLDEIPGHLLSADLTASTNLPDSSMVTSSPDIIQKGFLTSGSQGTSSCSISRPGTPKRLSGQITPTDTEMAKRQEIANKLADPAFKRSLKLLRNQYSQFKTAYILDVIKENEWDIARATKVLSEMAIKN